MNDDVRYIIEHMSPVELAMLRERGMVLPPRLAARADLAHARQPEAGDAERGPPANTGQGPVRGATAA